ncbi:hypothetical protein B0H12DRAFT_1238248 [Mycena haematopus]|nr:hypothetical protein B0H12DRAFT_1238248 [Mycena haematopus]
MADEDLEMRPPENICPSPASTCEGDKHVAVAGAALTSPMIDDDQEMTAESLVVAIRPAPESRESDKRRAVAGADRSHVDALTSDVAYYRNRLADETKRRKGIEKALAVAQSSAKHAEKNASEGAQFELNQYVKEYEAACRHHYQEQYAKLMSQLSNSQGMVVQLEASLAQASRALEQQDHDLSRLQGQTAAQEEVERRLTEAEANLQGQTAAQEEVERRLAEAEANLVTQKTAYEKAMAEKANEIAALMAKLRTTQKSTIPVPENFPATSPPLVPRFVSGATRKQRIMDKVVKTNNNRIPVTPLQLPSSSEMHDELESLDPTDDQSVARYADIVRQVMTSLGVVQIDVKDDSKKKKKRGPSQMAAEVKAQQARLTEEQDLLYKRGLRELWRVTYQIDIADGFKDYHPADTVLVAACNDGGNRPAPSDYNLDFGPGYATSLWNKAVVSKLVESFQMARDASDDLWGLPKVSDAYLVGELYGHLKRSQQAWALWRPRMLPTLMRMETEAEAAERAKVSQGRRQVSTGNRASRKAKLTRRLGVVEKVLRIKTIQGQPDVRTWEFFQTLLQRLDIAGMSSEDAEVRVFDGRPVNTFRIRFCAWRAPPITDYLRMIDDAGQDLKKTNASPRTRDGPEGRSAPPKGLPLKMYDETWLSRQHDNFIEDLEVSADVFEFLVAATSKSRHRMPPPTAAASDYLDLKQASIINNLVPT